MKAHNTSPEIEVLLEFLSDGKWHDGLKALREMQRVIPPGEASREGRAKVKFPEDHTIEKLIAIGRRSRARIRLTGLMERGRIERDVDKLAREHWSGELPWKIRDTQAGMMSAAEVADELDITESQLRLWVTNGFVPHSEVRGVLRFTPDQVEICRQVKGVWPGHGKVRWPVNPRSLWDPEYAPVGSTLVCPHCDQKIVVSVRAAD